MKFVTLSGKPKEIPIHKYRVDWDGDQGSQFSADVLDYLHTYWKRDVVLAELPVPGGGRMRYDFVNISKRIICETDGVQHTSFNSHFHGGSRNAYLAQIKRDLLKDKIAEANHFKMIRINPSDLPLSKDFFKRQFDIDL